VVVRDPSPPPPPPPVEEESSSSSSSDNEEREEDAIPDPPKAPTPVDDYARLVTPTGFQAAVAVEAAHEEEEHEVKHGPIDLRLYFLL